MSIPSYTLGYPPDGSSLGQTKSTIRNNLDGTFLTLSVDHQDANEVNAGYHNIIHSVLQGSDPAPIAGIGQLYPKNVTVGAVTDNQLFYESGAGVVTQLTGGSSTVGPSGTVVLPGGAVIKWGTQNVGANVAAGQVTFTPFPSGQPPFIIQMTPLTTTTSTICGVLTPIAPTPTTFSYYITNTGVAKSFYWFMIGS